MRNRRDRSRNEAESKGGDESRVTVSTRTEEIVDKVVKLFATEKVEIGRKSGRARDGRTVSSSIFEKTRVSLRCWNGQFRVSRKKVSFGKPPPGDSWKGYRSRFETGTGENSRVLGTARFSNFDGGRRIALVNELGGLSVLLFRYSRLGGILVRVKSKERRGSEPSEGESCNVVRDAVII